MTRYDAIVVGLGAVGSATLWQLARRGVRVLGLDRFSPPHPFGSSHGDTRVTRLAIGEGAHYTPLALRSHEIWREIERETGADILTTCGELIISSLNRTATLHVDDFFANTVAAAERFGIAHERLDASEIRRRFAQFAVSDEEYGYFEPDAGFVRPEAAIAAQLALALRSGAVLRTGETATAIRNEGGYAAVETDKARYMADRVIVCVGPWLPELIGPRYASLFRIYRQVLYWFDIDGPVEPFLPERFPVFIWETRETRQGIYGFPAIDGSRGGVKIATEQYRATTTPTEVSREVSGEQVARMHARCVAPYVPALGRRCVKAVTCLYTVTPDFGFVIDVHPDMDRVLVASPCSGHGFKHSAALGEALAERVLEGRSRIDLGAFGFARFSG